MLNQPYGLRFDIYERVHLSEGVPAIEELEEIELYPRIQVIGQDDHATLRGHLLLTGAYRGENENSEELKHFIPVEITVPLNRVRSIDDISIEIENFDVDLLSSRSLNITGVLSLRGIEGFPAEEPQLWSTDEFTVVHSADPQSESRTDGLEEAESDPQAMSAQQYLLQRSEEEELANAAELAAYGSPESADLSIREDASLHVPLQETPQPDWNQALAEPASNEFYEDTSPASSFMAETADRLATYPESEPTQLLEEVPTVWSEPSVNVQSEVPRPSYQDISTPNGATEQDSKPFEEAASPDVWHFEAARSVSPEEEQLIPETVAQSQTENWQEAFPSSEVIRTEEEQFSHGGQEANTFVHNEVSVPEPVAEIEDKPEVKVAFGSKREQASKQEDEVGISSLLSSGRATRDSEVERGEEVPTGVVPEDADQREDVEWKNLFLGTITDQTPFRKVKLCIVQREDTLDAIADRYQLSTRELQLYNRLTEQVVEEGQILYIP